MIQLRPGIMTLHRTVGQSLVQMVYMDRTQVQALKDCTCHHTIIACTSNLHDFCPGSQHQLLGCSLPMSFDAKGANDKVPAVLASSLEGNASSVTRKSKLLSRWATLMRKTFGSNQHDCAIWLQRSAVSSCNPVARYVQQEAAQVRCVPGL